MDASGPRPTPVGAGGHPPASCYRVLRRRSGGHDDRPDDVTGGHGREGTVDLVEGDPAGHRAGQIESAGLRQGDEVILSARPMDWSAYLAEHPIASEEFMEGVEELPFEDRSF